LERLAGLAAASQSMSWSIFVMPQVVLNNSSIFFQIKTVAIA